MRIISGKYKGLKLETLDGKNTRPTLTRVKEDAFNILNNYFVFKNKKSLDIFGGSGALTIEGLSRGIERALINDFSRDAISIIKMNLKKIKDENWEITNLDYMVLLNTLKTSKKTFDLIFMDPPFAKTQSYKEVFDFLYENKILNKWGMIIVESEDLLDKEIIKEFVLIKHKGYNKMNLYILRLER